MKAIGFHLLLATFSTSTLARAQSGWAYVPASRETHTLGLVESPYVPTDSVVNVIGETTPRVVTPAEPRKVISVELQESPKEPVDLQPRRESDLGTIPENAHWPDASGKIVAVLREHGEPSESPGVRNPWELRIHNKPTGNDVLFFYGGIIKGGDHGAIAIVNGRLVKTGDTLGEFTVAGILNAGLVIEGGGSYFVLPRARRTTVTTVGG